MFEILDVCRYNSIFIFSSFKKSLSTLLIIIRRRHMTVLVTVPQYKDTITIIETVLVTVPQYKDTITIVERVINTVLQL